MSPAAATTPEDARRRRHVLDTARGGGFLAGGSLFEYATRFVIALLLARLLGADDYGLYVLALGAGALFAGVAGLGLDDAMVRYVAIQASRGDRAGLWGTLRLGIGVSTAAAVVVAAALFVAAEPISTGMFDEPRLTSLLRLMALLVPFLTISNTLNGISRGFERTDVTALSENVVQSLVRVALLGLLVVVGRFDVVLAVLVFGISDVAASVTMLVLLERSSWPLRAAIHEPARVDVRPVFGFALPLWLSGLLRQSRNRIASILLGVSTGVASVGVYAVAEKVTLVGHVALVSVYVAVKPVLARLHDQGDHDGMAHLYRTASRWTLACYLPFFVVVVLLAEPLLGLFGERFRDGVTALWLLAAAELVGAATGICGSMIDMTGHTRAKLFNATTFTVVLIGGGALLIPRHGVLGAATASLLAVSAANILGLLEVWWFERLQPFDRTFLKPIAAALAATGVGLLLRAAWPATDDVATAAVHGGLVLVAYVAALVALRLPEHDRYVLGQGMRWGRRAVRVTGRALVSTVSRGRSL